MKKRFTTLLILASVLSLFFTTCNKSSSSSNDDCSDPLNSLNIVFNVNYDGSVEDWGYRYYRFTVSSSGNYTVSLINLTGDCDLFLYYYVSDCGDDYDWAAEEIDWSINGGTTSESIPIWLAPGNYLAEVSNFESFTVNYTFRVLD